MAHIGRSCFYNSSFIGPKKLVGLQKRVKYAVCRKVGNIHYSTALFSVLGSLPAMLSYNLGQWVHPRVQCILTKWNASWECWKLKSMYCRTDKAPSLTMGYSSLEKTWWREKSKWEGRMASQHAFEGPIRKWRPRASTTSTGVFLHLSGCQSMQPEEASRHISCPEMCGLEAP